MTITYTEKGAGLHEAIASAGHWLREIDGVWTSDNDAAVQSIIDGYTLAQAQTYIGNLLIQYADAKRQKVVAPTNANQMVSWATKYQQAQAYNGTDASAPQLAAEASTRGITTSALVSKVLTQGAAYLNTEAQIAGVQGKHWDAISALTTFAAVAAYDFTTGWPV